MNIIGIDLGTTNSVATVYEDDGLKHISFDGSDLLPSVVNVSDEGVLIGIKAKNMAAIVPENTAMSVKRLMGSDQTLILNNKVFTPEEVSALILKRIKERAEEEMNQSYTKCVVTVPAYFNEKQREATTRAVELAGMETLRILNEPTAAAISYGVDKDEDMIYAVYDLGGGTFDVSMVENSEGLIEVLATAGDNYLGGDDFDERLADLIWQKSGLDIGRTKKVNIRLMQLAEKCKIELSDHETMNIDEKFFAKKDGKPLHLEVEIEKEEFESLIVDQIDRTIELLLSAIEDAEIDLDDLEAILLTGGSSKIPLVTKRIFEKTGKLPILIEDPDKSVSIGAILQGAIIEGKNTNSILVDITPYSLGTAVLGRDDFELELSKIILKNTPIPVNKTSRYYGVQPYQSGFEISVYQGESEEDLDQNIKIGDMVLRVKDPVEDGAIDITFSLDQNGILNVSGVEVSTGESIQGEFKTKVARSTHHTQVNEMEILNDHDKSLLFKIDELLNKETVLDEDKEDLKLLRQKFIAASSDEKSTLEEEIVDTIFFLES